MYSSQQRTYCMNSDPDYSNSLMQSNSLQGSSSSNNNYSSGTCYKKMDYYQNTSQINRCYSDQYHNSTKPSLTYTMDSSSKSINAYPQYNSLPQVYEESYDCSPPLNQSYTFKAQLPPYNYFHQISIDNLERFKTIQQSQKQTKALQKNNKNKTPSKGKKMHKRSLSANNHPKQPLKNSNSNQRLSHDLNNNNSSKRRRNIIFSPLKKGYDVSRSFTNLDKVSNPSRSCSRKHYDDEGLSSIGHKYIYSDPNRRYSQQGIISNQIPYDNRNNYQDDNINHCNNNQNAGAEYSDFNKSQTISQINNLYQYSKSNYDDLNINSSPIHRQHNNNNSITISQTPSMNQYSQNQQEYLNPNHSNNSLHYNYNAIPDNESLSNYSNEEYINQMKREREQKFQMEKEKLRAKRYENEMFMRQEMENEYIRKSPQDQRMMKNEYNHKEISIREEEMNKRQGNNSNAIHIESNEAQQEGHNEEVVMNENAQTFGENSDINEEGNYNNVNNNGTRNNNLLHVSPNSEKNQGKESVETGQFNTLEQGNSPQKQLIHNEQYQSVPEEDNQNEDSNNQSKPQLKSKTQLNRPQNRDDNLQSNSRSRSGSRSQSRSHSKSLRDNSRDSNKPDNIQSRHPSKKKSSFKQSLKKLTHKLRNDDDITVDDDEDYGSDNEENNEDISQASSIKNKISACINEISKSEEIKPNPKEAKQEKFYIKGQKIKEAINQSNTIDHHYQSPDNINQSKYKSLSPNKQIESRLDQIPFFRNKRNERNDPLYQFNKTFGQSTKNKGNESLLSKIPSHYKYCFIPSNKSNYIPIKSSLNRRNHPSTYRSPNIQFDLITSSTVMPPNPYDTVVKAREYFFVEDS